MDSTAAEAEASTEPDPAFALTDVDRRILAAFRAAGTRLTAQEVHEAPGVESEAAYVRKRLTDLHRAGLLKRPRRGVYALPSGQKNGDDTRRSPGAADVPAPSPNAGPMEIPREHARAIAFPERSDAERDLSTVALAPQLIIEDGDGRIRFRVSYLVEAAPPERFTARIEGG